MSEVKNEGLEVVAYARRWFGDGEVPAKEINDNGRMAWPGKFKLLPLTPKRCLKDDEPLCRHSEALAGYAVLRVRIVELEEWQADAILLIEKQQAELAAIKAQEPVAKPKAPGCTKPGCFPYCDCGGIDSAPVAKQVVMPERMDENEAPNNNEKMYRIGWNDCITEILQLDGMKEYPIAADHAEGECKGKSCGATDGVSHSAECVAEHEQAYNCAKQGGQDE